MDDLKGDIEKMMVSWMSVKDGFREIADYVTDENINPYHKNWSLILEYIARSK